MPPRLDYELRPPHGPTVLWAGIRVPRVWRCGNRGNVASVLIEKPARGDFLPILDGGFSLQYSPLLEYREGRGMVLFCQLDVTGRTGPDPAADALVRNLLRYATSWKPSPQRDVVYAGDADGPRPSPGRRDLRAALAGRDARAGSRPRGRSRGPAGDRGSAQEVADWVEAGGRLLAIGLDEEDAAALLPGRVRMRKAEHIAAFFEPFGAGSPFAGVGPADVHNRDPRTLPLVAGGAEVVGDGVLAGARSGHVVFCQLVPWQFDYGQKLNVKRTYRHAAFLVSRLLANLGAARRRRSWPGSASPRTTRLRRRVGSTACTSTGPRRGTIRTASSAGERRPRGRHGSSLIPGVIGFPRLRTEERAVPLLGPRDQAIERRDGEQRRSGLRPPAGGRCGGSLRCSTLAG